jgi:hypothetical protein
VVDLSRQHVMSYADLVIVKPAVALGAQISHEVHRFPSLAFAELSGS